MRGVGSGFPAGVRGSGVGGMSGIYTASKTRHAHLWRAERGKGLPIISTWIDEAEPGQTADMGELWERCVLEASTADALVLYREGDETLKGALVEVGAALAAGKRVFVVADCSPSEYSWLDHPLVVWCESLEQAMQYACAYAYTSKEATNANT